MNGAPDRVAILRRHALLLMRDGGRDLDIFAAIELSKTGDQRAIDIFQWQLMAATMIHRRGVQEWWEKQWAALPADLPPPATCTRWAQKWVEEFNQKHRIPR